MLEEKRYLTISQVARICSTSRSTILRMEKDGILKPAYVNEENGYRYYDQDGVMRIMRNLSFQEVGVTHKELRQYYEEHENYEQMLELLETKLKKLHAMTDALKVETQGESEESIDFFTFQEVYCYSQTLNNLKDYTKVRGFLWDAMQEVLDAGLSPERSMHPFVSIDVNAFFEHEFEHKEYDFTVNIPVVDNKLAQSNENVVVLAPVKTISSYLYGGSDKIRDTFIKLGREIEAKKLKICGPARIISIVKSVPGEDILKKFWVTRVCIPVE